VSRGMPVLLAISFLSSLLDPVPVDINTADSFALESIAGIGPATAEAIILYRETVSEFHSVDELVFVPGVGPATLEAIRSRLTAVPVEVDDPGVDPVILRTPEDTLLTVVFLDVGNGDAIVLTAGGNTWMVDCGPPGEGGLRAPVVQRLMEAGIDSLDAVAFTHPHADHIGGVTDAMEVFHCRRLIDPGIDHASPVYENLLMYALDSCCAYETADSGDVWNISGDVALEVVWLRREACSANEASAVYMVTCGDFSMLLTGDIENETIMELTMGQGPVSVMKVPHHGSRSSLFPPWIRRASPGIAVFCCGRGNPFGHPHPDVVQAWAETGAEILRTDLNGNIFLVTDGESMTFTKTLSR